MSLAQKLEIQKYMQQKVSFQNSTETSILSSVKQIASPGWMHKTSAQGWCTGKTQRDGMGNTCKSMADSCQCMAKPTTIL